VEEEEQLSPLDKDLHVIEPLLHALQNVKNEVMISDGPTQGTKVADHTLHPGTIVTDAEVALLEDAELAVELQNT
jgi:hypothetical protein